MSKRFTDTAKWTNNKWFFELSIEFKLFWIYLLDNCDSVGVWEENIALSNIIIGYEYPLDTLLKKFKKQIYLFKDNRKWWIVDFCDFQYGKLLEDSSSKPIQSYISLLKKHTLWKEYLKGIKTLKEKEKVKDKVMDKEKEIFNSVRELFPGTKKGNDTEYDNFVKKHKDWKDVLPLLLPAVEKQIKYRANIPSDKFIPEWKNFQTWIYQRCWEDEMPKTVSDDEWVDKALNKIRNDN